MPKFTELLRRAYPALLVLSLLGACAFSREPPHDPHIADALAELAIGTQVLLRELQTDNPKSHSGRAERYATLSARAETIRLMAEAREVGGARTGGVLRGVAARAGQAAGAAIGEGKGASAFRAQYSEATPAFMADYLRNLAKLEAHDRGATGSRDAQIARHREALATQEQALARYLADWRRYVAGQGPRPAAPPTAPDAPKLALNAGQLALRKAALEDILRDALVYERLLLNRQR